MTFTLNRLRNTSHYLGVIGELFLPDDSFFCYTLENSRFLIPPGSYRVRYTYSPKFRRDLPLLEVPGHSGIRIHPANYPSQLRGCIALGTHYDKFSVLSSKVAVADFISVMSSSLDPIVINIVDCR